jgi:dTDP-4-amino-4,6-dideoxygalactose transaminase
MLRDEILEKLNTAGYMSRPGWDLINTLKPYASNPTMNLENSDKLFKSLINIPSSSNLIG